MLTVCGRVGLVDPGMTFGCEATVMMSGACPPPAPSVWYAWIDRPAIAHGIDSEVGSVEVGKLADLVLWDPAYFAIRPRLVLKGGAIAYAPMGDANASIPTPQPVLMRPMFAGSGRLAGRRSLAFVSPLAVEGLADLGLEAGVVAVSDTRSVTKADMPFNDACPDIRVDPDTFKVWIDGDEVVPDPASELPLAQRYSLF